MHQRKSRAHAANTRTATFIASRNCNCICAYGRVREKPHHAATAEGRNILTHIRRRARAEKGNATSSSHVRNRVFARALAQQIYSQSAIDSTTTLTRLSTCRKKTHTYASIMRQRNTASVACHVCRGRVIYMFIACSVSECAASRSDGTACTGDYRLSERLSSAISFTHTETRTQT